jgi:DNA polymerase
MTDPEQISFNQPTLDELAAWLKYYRALGFTHLYGLRETSASAQDRLAEQQSPSASLAAPSGGETMPRRPHLDEHDSAVASPPLGAGRALGGSLFDSVGPRETLEQVREDLGDCRRCKLAGGRKTIVFGSGNPKAELLFVGEGPGADEDEQGLPFVGRAGQLLTQMIEKGMKIPRPEVYICNVVKCRPPGNRKPEKDEVAACRQFVERQIDAVKPRVIVVLGATAVETLLGLHQSMGSLRGRWQEFHGIPLMITYHPAFLLRDPTRKPEAWEDLKKVIALLQSSAGEQARTAPGEASG